MIHGDVSHFVGALGTREAEPGFVQFDFVDEALTMAAVMSRDIGA